MFLNSWHAAAKSDEVKETPVHVRVLGQDFVLFRNQSGEAHCLSNVCVHRGGSLAHGKVKGDCVECPYHGWQFNGGGACTRIPSMGPDAKIPSRAKVDSYPVDERYGLIFCFLGEAPEAERTPILDIPEWDHDDWRTVFLVYDWQTNIDRAVENSLDLLHVEFVHDSLQMKETFDMEGRVESRIIEYEHGATFRVTKPSGYLVEHGYHGATHHWTYVWIPMGPKLGKLNFYSYMTPIDEHTVRRYLFHARDFALDPSADEGILAQTGVFEQEDRQVVENIRPVMAPTDQTHEIMLVDDQIVVHYRERQGEWEAKGWRIDVDRVRENENKVAYAIPSPERRKSKGWALDPIPTLDPASRTASRAAE